MQINFKNDLFFRALQHKPVVRPPVWLMRQAGRYLPEYQKLRQEAGSFLNLCQSPDMASEAALQPIRRFGFDVAILFSDILTIPGEMGLGLDFVEGEGPRFAFPLREERDILALEPPDMEKLDYVFSAVKQTVSRLGNNIPLIGFAGSPFTLACYMIEGKGKSGFQSVRCFAYKRPDLMRHILRVNTESVRQYLVAQARAGATALMIFDSWGGELHAQGFSDYSLPYLSEIVSGVQAEVPEVPIIVFVKGGGCWLEDIVETVACDAVGIDWHLKLSAARKRIGGKVAIQGNLDPAVLLAGPEATTRETRCILDDFGGSGGHIFNLGHGIYPNTPIESVSALVETVKKHTNQPTSPN